jgi:cytochrome oxidase Cu insertion factor (SCO1/SenC/PrrC family)
VPGMNSGLSPTDPTLVAAFRSALLHQGGIALLIIAFLWLLWATVRVWRLTTPVAKPAASGAAAASDTVTASGTTETSETSAAAETEETSETRETGGARPARGAWATGGPGRGGAGRAGTWAMRGPGRGGAGRGGTWAMRGPGRGGTGHDETGRGGTGRGRDREARGRRLLRIGFGLIWILDGILQAQPKMAAGLASQVIQPTAAASPTWVQHLVNWGGTIWSYHPITSGAASVWIQVGIGLWLLVAKDGPWSRLAGLAAVAWGLVVWVFGESFGGIFAPGLSWTTGAPGAVLIYMVAGALIALPEDAWRSPRLGRLLLGGIGLFFIGMAVLQAWPGRGFWQGNGHGQPGTLASMVQQMSGTSQPHFLSALLANFGSFAASNGFAVNLVVVIVLAAMGAIFLTVFIPGRPRLVRWAVWFGIVFCLADWVLVQDLGFLGGLGTDPNSMIPWILLFSAGYLALTPAPQEAPAAVPAGEGETASRGWRQQLKLPTPKTLGAAVATASARSVAAVGALAIIVLGAAPMTAAAANRTADPILAEAIEGSSNPVDYPAPAFQLTDQNGQTVSLASLRGKVVLMTFLDPVCTTDCPLIAAEFKEAGVLLGSADKDVDLVAIVANPIYRSVAFTQAFDRQEGLSTVPNWLYLTGSLSQLNQVWRQYGIAAEILPAGAMIDHSDVTFVIDRTGHVRQEVGADPGPGTTSTQSSYSVLLTQYAHQVLSDS